MNVQKRIASISLVLFLILICGCNSKSSGNVTGTPVETKVAISSTPTATIAQAESEDKSADIKKEEALQVLKDYFAAVKEHDTKDPFQYYTDRLKHGSFSNVKDTNLINIADDVGNKAKSNYKRGRGSISNPYDVICFEVTFDTQFFDDNIGSEPSGTVTKWFTLIKETETSSWLIDEVGY